MGEVPKESVGYAVKTLRGSSRLQLRIRGWNPKGCQEFKAKELGLYLTGAFSPHLLALVFVEFWKPLLSN